MVTQTVWVVIILLATWYCYEGARFDRTPLRLLAFLAIIVGVGHGLNELHKLALVLQGREFRFVFPIELILPFALVGGKYFHRQRLVRVPVDG